MRVLSAGRYDVKIEKDTYREWLKITATPTAGPVTGTFQVNVHADGKVTVRDDQETVNVDRHADKPGFDVSLTFVRNGNTWELDRSVSNNVFKSWRDAHDFRTPAPKTYAAAVIAAATEIVGQLPAWVFDHEAREGLVRSVNRSRSEVNRLTAELATAQDELDAATETLDAWDRMNRFVPDAK